MQLKPLSLLAGAIALTLTTTPFVVHAQANSSAAPVIAQGARKGPWESLGLTDDQKAKIKQIMDNSRTQIESVFTPEQKAKLEAARQARQAQRQQGQRPQAGKRGNVLADLNLTQDQKNRIKSIRQSSKQQIEAVLTTEQRAKLQELKASRRQRWQQRQNNQTPPQNQ
ncbi:Spy/CpxP family protein refolding chaperone [Nostoc sp. MS1]|uniref:Spy/CpxP family protein refolding chaperone n=1 Tax=Nostoc sp. MS1 TaxID=2764711 RepID=UPI001CC61276|nr:P pilus assembly/Cpx signaling pathway, periplasmic inhibitor/zinc-resistance associated protein [Nostoc sp. MS1]BCL34893.1 hypothetical protein NSMS1_13400 [Nostoc sp. MS1]